MTKKAYEFSVEMVPCYIKDPKTGKEIPIKNRMLVYSPEKSKNEVFDAVTPLYELVEHKDVVDIVKKNLIPDLGWKIKKEDTYLSENKQEDSHLFRWEMNC